jgi:acyl-CoA thioester hydrolase
MDSFGHLNNASYLTYIEEARIKYFNEIVHWHYDWSKTGIILARAELDFKLPGYFTDQVVVKTGCTRIGTKSMNVDYEIIRIKNGKEELIANAKSVLVMYDYEKEVSIPIPDHWRQAIAEYEGIRFS